MGCGLGERRLREIKAAWIRGLLRESGNGSREVRTRRDKDGENEVS